MSRYEKKLKDKMEALVPEELEQHLILNSNRLRTFEDARLEVVTYVEAKFGLTIRDSMPSDTSTRGRSDPLDVDAVDSLSSAKEKGSSSPRGGCCKCGGAHFQRDCNARESKSKQSYSKGKQSMSWSKSEPSFSDEGKSEENPKENPKENPMENLIENPKEPKVRTKVPRAYLHKCKTSRTNLSNLQNSI